MEVKVIIPIGNQRILVDPTKIVVGSNDPNGPNVMHLFVHNCSYVALAPFENTVVAFFRFIFVTLFLFLVFLLFEEFKHFNLFVLFHL